MTIPYIITDDSITVVVHGKPFTTSASNANYTTIKARIAAGQFDGIEKLFDTGAAVGAFTKGNIVVQDNAVLYKGNPVHNHVVDRILAFMRDGLPYQPLVNFLDNLMANPSFRAVQELYGFLEASDLPITEDGCFLAYRKVTQDYKDFYTGKFDNSIGAVVKMERNLVDEDQNRTCSKGLHFCSYSYLSQYHGGEGRVVIVKINPANVVAIPTDYNNAKGRCCEYLVLSECAGYEQGQQFGALYQTSPAKAFDDGEPVEVEEVLNSEESYELGYNYGEDDAADGKIRNANAAYQTEGDLGLNEVDFINGYHAGYDEYLAETAPVVKVNIKPAPVAQVAKVGLTTREKLSALAQKAKRGPDGRFVK